jgi:isocitrate dehydrogenase kinase/phosphatase
MNEFRYIDQGTLIVNGCDTDTWDTFIVFEHAGLYFSVEHSLEFNSSVVIHQNLNAMVKAVGWADYIFAGITEHGKEVLKDHMEYIKNYQERF